jgi:hypothetical protein
MDAAATWATLDIRRKEVERPPRTERCTRLIQIDFVT